MRPSKDIDQLIRGSTYYSYRYTYPERAITHNVERCLAEMRTARSL